MVEWDMIAPMAVAVVSVLTIGGVLVLRPIARQVGGLLEAMAKEKAGPNVKMELTQIRELLDTTNGRLGLLEERQDFTDQLLSRRTPDSLPAEASKPPEISS